MHHTSDSLPDLTALTSEILEFISNTKPGAPRYDYSGLEGEPRTISVKTPDGRWGAGLTAFEKRRPDVHLHIALVLDISGSMTDLAADSIETKLDVALQCIDNICRSPFLADDDMLNVIVFSGSVQDVLEAPLNSFDYRQFKATVDQAPKGLTAARDGVLHALRKMLKARTGQAAAAGKREVIRYILTFTDGADNASKTSVDKLSSFFQAMRAYCLENLYFNMIATGLDDCSRSAWAGISGQPGCRLQEITRASEMSIKQAFCEALVHIRHLVMVDTLTQELHLSTYSGDMEGATETDKEFTSLIVQLMKSSPARAYTAYRTAAATSL